MIFIATFLPLFQNLVFFQSLSSLGVVDYFSLPTLGEFLTLLVRKNFLHTTKAALIEQPSIGAIERNRFALFLWKHFPSASLNSVLDLTLMFMSQGL